MAAETPKDYRYPSTCLWNIVVPVVVLACRVSLAASTVSYRSNESLIYRGCTRQRLRALSSSAGMVSDSSGDPMLKPTL